MLADPEERVFVDARRHGIVLVRPLTRSIALAAAGTIGCVVGWPLSVPGAVLLVVAAAVALAAVWRWDRTHVVLTSDKLFVVHGLLRKRAAAVRLAKVSTVEVEQSFLGRVLGYGTLVAGELEISAVPRPRELCGLVQRLSD
ncbi:MAG TPA: PH domain-containing protein [Gaiellaceae bacterium]|nr:PH domain-containing protein [Gaiellaceae bacterium]